ncbi:XRE family transcriptional regulator [Listeria monocytogenes]|nr:XRE family transcriptional regulator [Listeria monocytogenes]EAG1759791.1 XRE family transcriptional regulator [Listeria monocytogenes]
MLEETLNFPSNTIYQWKQRTPGIDKLQKVADYFNVSVNYLLGRTDVLRIPKDNPALDIIAAYLTPDTAEQEIEELIAFIEAKRKEKKT